MRTPVAMKRAALVLAAMGVSGVLFAQDAPPPAQAAPPPQLTPEQLDTLVAPVALYSDALLSQVFMASTYPLEVVEAERFTQSNPNLSADQLTDQLNQQTWDPSVKSLVNVPSVLQLMDEKLDWTIKLGDAFLAQQPDVMGSVQRLRLQAQQSGNLQSTQQQTISYETPEQGVTDTQPYIVINNTDPDYAYVPVYDPFIIFGTWRYPSHPWFWHPHDYVPTHGIWWGDRYQYGPAWGYAWGRPDWHGHDINIDVHRNVTFNSHIDRNVYITQYNRDVHVDEHANAPFAWKHDPEHRLGVSYADPRIARQYGGRTAAEDVRQREQYRGRTDDNALPQRAPNGVNPGTDARAQEERDAAAREAARTKEDRPADTRAQPSHDEQNHSDNDRPKEVRPDNNPGPTPTPVPRPSELRPEPVPHPEPTPAPTPSNGHAEHGGAFEGAGERGGDVAADSARGSESRGDPHGSAGASPEPAHSSGGEGGGGGGEGGGGPHGGKH